MNKFGQSLMFALMIAFVIFISGMLFMNHILPEISAARTIGLDCSSDTISDGTKITCLGVDFLAPILILAIVSVSIGAILSRFII